MSGNTIEFFKVIGSLKHLKRTGWVKRNVGYPETVSGHMYRMAIMSFLFDSKDEIDSTKVMKMSLVHDMAESIVGDITPHCGVSEEDKHNREKNAMTHIASLINKEAGKEMHDLFMEYENQLTSEAKLVKDLDKFDMIMQAFEYESMESRPGQLEEFFKSTEGKFKHPKVKEWVDQLYQQRKEFIMKSDSSDKE